MASDNSEAKLAEALRSAIKKKRVSMKLISERLNVSYRTVQNYLSGENRISADFLLGLCHLLQIDADFFIYGDFRPRYYDLYDAVLASLRAEGLIPALDHETDQQVREQALALASRMTAEIAAGYDRFRAASAFGPFLNGAPFGERERKRR